MKTFVGKNTKLKQAAVGHAIMQAVRSRTAIASLQICLGVPLHLEIGPRFAIETLHRLGFCSSYQNVQKYQFLQFMADNIDHNTQTLDGLNTFHNMWMIKAVTPGTNVNQEYFPV